MNVPRQKHADSRRRPETMHPSRTSTGMTPSSTLHGSRRRREKHTACRAKPNGNMPREAASKRSTGGAINSSLAWPIARTAPTSQARSSRSRSAASSQIHSGSTIWAAVSISGSRIAGTGIIREPRPMVRPGLTATATRALSGPARGEMTRVQPARRAEIDTRRWCAIRPTASELLSPRELDLKDKEAS